MSDQRSSLPIAVFDSGIGGLTVLHELLVSLPAESYLYLGDTAGFPYGTKSVDWLRPRIDRLTRFLLDRGSKLLVVACNSATSAAGDQVRRVAEERGVEVLTVVDPEAEIAAAISDSGRVGVLATPTTVAAGAYRRALDRHGRELEVTEVAAPDLAPIIQSGFPFDQRVMDTVRSYCAPMKRADVDTLILGCTHYPLVAPMLQRMLGRDVRLVTPATRRGGRRSGCWRAGPRGADDARGRRTASSAPATVTRSASSGPASCSCRSATSSRST